MQGKRRRKRSVEAANVTRDFAGNIIIATQDAVRFFKKVSATPKIKHPKGCHEWQGRPNDSGYGQFRLFGRTHLAHMVAWWLHYKHNNIPLGFVIMHICDNRICVNPKHLTLGSQATNMQDMVLKGRARNGHSKT